jgi:1-acyl-sn-glycerol-3-phosphate acyltransferase
MKDFFPGDQYDTPDGLPRSIGDRILLGSRWWFYILFARIIFHCRSLALKGVYDRERWVETSIDVLRSIERCGGRVCIRGLDHLRDITEPTVIIGNHMSALETVVLPAIVANFFPVTFVAKDKLMRGPVFSPILKSREPVVVGRSNPRKDLETVLKKGTETLERGVSIIIFPQSTRRVEFSPAQFNSLGVKLARRAGVKVMPMALKTDFWGNGKYLRGFGPLDRRKIVHFEFGKPMAIKKNGSEEHQQIVAFIQDRLKQWQAGAKSISPPPAPRS